MQSSDEKSGFYAAILFIVWPFLALITAFANNKKKWAVNLLWAFVAFYGFSFTVGAESQGSDIVEYIEEVEQLHTIEMTIPDMFQYYQESGEVDILRTLIAVTLSRITGSNIILTLIYGIIFGFFFSRNMWFVLDRLKGNTKIITVLLFACFFLVVPIWNINGFRMWTAAHIFIYGLLPYLFEGKKKGILIATLSILVHFSFLIPVGLLFTYILVGNRLVIYFFFFLTTFFVSEIDLAVFNNFVENYAPEIVQERTAGYRGEQYVETYREGTEETRVWYAVWYGRALKWSVMGFLVILFIKEKSFFYDNRCWLNLFSFTLLFYGVANLFSSLPSGGRFLSVVNLCALALIILFVQNRDQEAAMGRFVWIATPALILFIVVSIRTGLYSMSAAAILGNPFIAFFLREEHISLNDVMRMIL